MTWEGFPLPKHRCFTQCRRLPNSIRGGVGAKSNESNDEMKIKFHGILILEQNYIRELLVFEPSIVSMSKTNFIKH